jgi:hypothetical protein
MFLIINNINGAYCKCCFVLKLRFLTPQKGGRLPNLFRVVQQKLYGRACRIAQNKATLAQIHL